MRGVSNNEAQSVAGHPSRRRLRRLLWMRRSEIRALASAMAARPNSSHDVKQRRFLRSRGACCARVVSLCSRPSPIEGRAERRQAHLCCRRACEARPSALVRRGASHDAGRSPLGAPPWRFSAGGRASISGIASGSVQRAPRSQVVMPGGRCPGPPSHCSGTPGDNR
jgi:hypothetical protein